MQGDSQGKLLLSYDPSLVPVCGGMAATLVYAWFEGHLFKATAGAPATVPSFRGIHETLGMRHRHFCHSIKTIAVVHTSTKVYQLRKLAGMEFIHPQSRLEVFYAVEITTQGRHCIIHRNHAAIDKALALARQSFTKTIVA